MNINDVVTLARAGFTAQQISTMMSAPQGVEHSEEPAVHTDLSSHNLSAVPAAVPPAAEPVPAATPSAAQASASPDTGMAELLAAVRSLEQTVRAGNINSSRQPDPQSCDDILASIINP